MPEIARTRIRPKERLEPLLNPHKGCATFQRFNGDPLYEGMNWSESGPTEFPPPVYEGTTPGYLPCTVAYCRWFWELLEPREGVYDWTVVEGALAAAEARGQTLQVRLMPHGSVGQPMIPAWYAAKYPTREAVTHAGYSPCTVPVYDSPEYVDKWGAFISAFGARFDGHPWLESADVSFIGPWGEGAGVCSRKAVDAITQRYVDAHPKTPLMTMISDYKMRAGVRRGTGWRLDCFGDVGIFANPNLPLDKWWMHHYDCYPQSVCRCGAQDAWKKAPVTFESCSVPMRWFLDGFDLGFILQQGRKFHGSVFMPKSARLPEEYMEPLSRFCNDLGYRFVLRQASVSARVTPGRFLHADLWIENVGVAPMYRPYALALELSIDGRRYVTRARADVRKWLPGDICLAERLPLPADLPAGTAVLRAGLVDSELPSRVARFANEGVGEDGWLFLGTVEVAARKAVRRRVGRTDA